MKNINQNYIASALKISQKAYSKIEAGKTKLDLKRLIKIAIILDVPAESLLKFEKIFAAVNFPDERKKQN
jgi:XRE family transcriptional regulator, regulator of sulfur utilization